MVKLQQLLDNGYEFFTGVPDSGLKPFINEIIENKRRTFNKILLIF